MRTVLMRKALARKTGGAKAQEQRVADVHLGEGLVPVGRLRFTQEARRQHSEFRYAESWIEDRRRAFALAPDLPLGPASFFATMGGVGRSARQPAGGFQDATPDAWGRLLMERVHGSGLSEFDLLTLADDATRQGALRFLDEEGGLITGDRQPVPSLMQIEALREAAVRVEGRREMSNEDLRQMAGAGGSLGGARPKANVADGDALWIAKFSSMGDQSPVERMEVATLDLARSCGLRTRRRASCSGGPASPSP